MGGREGCEALGKRLVFTGVWPDLYKCNVLRIALGGFLTTFQYYFGVLRITRTSVNAPRGSVAHKFSSLSLVCSRLLLLTLV